jgi:outer membrane scaffolding protein for murein synthesis (MipA/OmpV family)
MTFRAFAAPAILCAVLASTGQASAQLLIDQGESLPMRPGQTPWTLTLGAFGGVGADYEGSNDYRFFGAPVVDLRYRDLFFLSVRDGLGVSLVRIGGFTAGPMVRVRFGRDQDDNDALKGLGDVGPTIEGGLFARYRTGGFVFGVEGVQGLNGDGHRGATLHANAGYGGRLAERWRYSLGPSVTWADGNYTRTYFGISQDQAARSVYSPYDAQSGFKDVAFGGTLTWSFTDAMAVTAIAEVKQLLGDAADSPIVDQAGSATQGFLGLSLSYRFGW